MRALFLDRDGTVSEEVGYINHISRFRLFPWTAEAISRAREAGWKVILITNQAGAARGYFPLPLIEETHHLLQLMLQEQLTQMDAIYYCPHHPESVLPELRVRCDCRKPKPGMLMRAAREHGIRLEDSWMIGDRYLDLQTGHSAGTRSAMVFTGYGRGEYQYTRDRWTRQPDIIADNLLEAVRAILSSGC